MTEKAVKVNVLAHKLAILERTNYEVYEIYEEEKKVLEQELDAEMETLKMAHKNKRAALKERHSNVPILDHKDIKTSKELSNMQDLLTLANSKVVAFNEEITCADKTLDALTK